jgi:hypothetical protein
MHCSFSFIWAYIFIVRFPKDAHKRRLWLRALNREGFVPSEHSCVCSEHFVSGWHSDDPSDENYGPTIFSYKEKPVDEGRLNRAARRNIEKVIKFKKKMNNILQLHYVSI